MSAGARAAILKELFGTGDREIGVSYLRLTIGASDLNERVFTYDDMPDGQTDPDLRHFDLGPDKADVIPVMKEILKLNPRIKILASPWTAPSWMKTNNNAKGGALKPEAYDTYARYFTEQMVVGSVESKPAINIAAPVRRLIIGATRNWSRNVLLWNLAADPKNNPHTDNGGCGMCQGAITIDGDQVSRNLAYYAVAHASKFVRPGAVRISSTSLDALPNVAFRTASGKRVLIVVNASQTTQTFDIRAARRMTSTLAAGAVATYVW